MCHFYSHCLSIHVFIIRDYLTEFPCLMQLAVDVSRRRPVFDARPDHVAFVTDKVVLEQIFIFSKYCCFPCQNHSTKSTTDAVYRYASLNDGDTF